MYNKRKNYSYPTGMSCKLNGTILVEGLANSAPEKKVAVDIA